MDFCQQIFHTDSLTFLIGKDKFSTLTPLQLKIVNYIEEKGETSAEQIMENIKLSEEEFRREFAGPRHMELLRATKKGDKIFYTLFYKKS
jgi:predicted HTH transcriptional regulator